ncbi:hypothetical protein IWQ60_010137 [Tieghemiomyces parasiticus]|uniref:TAFII55 protein conserved region domain-containing protein n=1 Tax=Tieghemiomyces parasiticus TaxID=78921 RepID=A0A9W7ZR58_9FUNG|nr:hypothetical protein IWQ60_010137 [Tieghemiomyces parasiticus]
MRGARSRLASARLAALAEEEGGDDFETEVATEQHIILRMANPAAAEQLRTKIRAKDLDGVQLRFSDERHASFALDADHRYDALLADLPTIIEAQKTFDNRQMFKIADISQILVVGSASEIASSTGLDPHDPTRSLDGITPPLRNCRRRRFRKREVRGVEDRVEKELERLLQLDAEADTVQFDLRDIGEADGGSGDEMVFVDTPAPADSVRDYDVSEADPVRRPGDTSRGRPGLPGSMGAATGGVGSSGAHHGNEDEDDDYDDDLAAELSRQLAEMDDEDTEDHLESGRVATAHPGRVGRSAGGEDDDEEEGDEEGEEGDEDGEEDEEDEDEEEEEDEDDDQDESDDDDDDSDDSGAENGRHGTGLEKKLLADEIKELQTTIGRKVAELDTAPNLIIKKRFEDIIQRLRSELEMKTAQLAELNGTVEIEA